MKLSYQYKSIARSNLTNNWGTAILVCLISLAFSAVGGFIPVFGAVIVLLLSGQLAVGEMQYFTKLHKKENPTLGTMFDNFSKNLISNLSTYVLQSIYLVLWTLLFIIPGIIKTYSYAMTMYLKSKKPELTSNEAITMSREIIDGKKWKYCCLQFSFIGWIILSILTLGIGFIFLLPYMQATSVAFFEDAYNEKYPEIIDNSSDDNIIIE